MPTQPTSIREMCITHHEIFNSYIEAGFNPEQALQLTIAVVSVTIASEMGRGQQL